MTRSPIELSWTAKKSPDNLKKSPVDLEMCPDFSYKCIPWSIFGPCLCIKFANILLRVFVANLKIDVIYAFYPESFCNKNLAILKVFSFSDSDFVPGALPDFVPDIVPGGVHGM